MNDLVKKVCEYIKEKTNIKPKVAIIVSKYHREVPIDKQIKIAYKDIPNFPALGSDLQGEFIVGTIKGVSVIMAHGRFHLYNGYKNGYHCFPIYVFKELGCKALIINTGMAAINPRLKVGDIVEITDHINLSGRNPLFSDNMYLGHTRFIDVSSAYTPELLWTAKQVGKKMGLKIKTGTLVQFSGPTRETVSEIRAARLMRGDLAGFNIMNEAIACVYCGMQFLGLGTITNYATGVSKNKIKYEDVKYNMKCAEEYLCDFLVNLISNI